MSRSRNPALPPLDSRLLDGWQRDFPLVRRPFARIGSVEGASEAAIIAAFRRLVETGRMTRIGAVVAPNAIGASTLAAMQVPSADIERIAAIVSAEPYVTHNYERENAVNLWFVVAAPDRHALESSLGRIAAATGLEVLDLRLRQAFHLDLGFGLAEPTRRRAHHEPDLTAVVAGDRDLLAAIEDGLPLEAAPFAAVGQRLGRSEADVIGRLDALARAGIVRRFGAIVRHRALGMTANGMAVWDIRDDEVEAIGRRFATDPAVTLCYRRDRAADWPYNLYCMVHARRREQALATIRLLDAVAGSAARHHAVLFSTRCYKQTGARFSMARRAA